MATTIIFTPVLNIVNKLYKYTTQPETNTFLSNRGLTLTLKPDLKRWAQAGQKSISASLGGGENQQDQFSKPISKEPI